VLLIEFSPGGAEAYVDDEPVGTTSPEGRLRLSRLDPGQHRVRLALDGYRDYEQKVELVAGKTAKVGGTLQTAKAAVPANPQPAGTPARTEAASNPAYLGVAFVPNQPVGAKGVVISGAEPGSPAERAGLRPYNVILGIGGRQVTTPAALQEAIAGHQAGDVVDLTVYDGKQNVTRRVQLASRAAVGPSGQLSGAAAAIATMSAMAGQAANTNLAHFYVAHDHGPPAPNFCVGILTLGNGMIKYRSSTGIHPLDIPFAEIKEAKKNSVYLAAFGGFHVRLRKGTVYNFAVIDNAGQYQRPDALLAVLDRAVSK
jgi:hypothetical protein